MESIKFKEAKTIKVKAIGITLIVVSIFILLQAPSGIVLTCIGLVVLGLQKELEVFKSFDNKMNFYFFNLKLYTVTKELVCPEYISLAAQSFSLSNDFNTVSALGSTAEIDFYVIRFFDENNRNDIIFKSKNKTEVLEKGTKLASLLNVELLNKLEH
ncbi:MAG: hypothetical protein ACPGU9_01765 [Flavobacteriaceae bacterium]